MTVNRKSIIISISSYELTKDEKSLIFSKKPWGIILFKRNIKDFNQLKNLTKSIRNLMNDPYYPIMIDEEGGKVSRLSKLIDNSNYSQNFFGNIFEKNNLLGLNSYKKYLYFICGFLKELGININTIPVLDIIKKNTHNVIGNRSYSKKIHTINSLKDICFNVSRKYKIGSVSKHIPGHGCSNVDTHKKLAVTKDSLKTLLKNDFKTFKNIHSEFAMTAHIVYQKIDPVNTATHSKTVIKEIIRNKLGFKGILISDDISMGALSSNILYNAKRALFSGCNLVLYCKGNIKESSLLLNNLSDIDNLTTKKTSEFYSFLR